MPSSWLTLIPPVTVIASAFIFRRIQYALLLGVILALIIAGSGNFYASLSLGICSVKALVSHFDTLCLYGFLTCLGILVALFDHTKSARAFAHNITNRIRSSIGVEYASVMLSLCMFVDDYLSILAIGNMMSPIADHYKMARLKLAFLIHSLAGPLVVLFPISSWAATIVMYLTQAGVNSNAQCSPLIIENAFALYLASLPYVFYSFLIIASVWAIIRYDISFGPMRRYEDAPVGESTLSYDTGKSSIWGLILPLVVLVVSTLVGLLCMHFVTPQNQHPFLVILLAAVFAIITNISVCTYQGTFSRRLIYPVIRDGISIMLLPITIVFLASMLSGLLAHSLGTGQYMAILFPEQIPLFLLPCIFFIGSLVTTFATGSAWGTFALVMPIAIPMITTLTGIQIPLFPDEIPLLLPSLGAIFSGAVCGDHISPISDTSTMTAASTRTNAIEHCKTQFFYALPAIVGCLAGFTAAGYCALSAPQYVLYVPIILASITCFLTLAVSVWVGKLTK